MQPAPSAIHSVSGSNVKSQFHYAFANGLRIAKVAGFELPQSGRDTGFRHFVSKCRDPLDERGTPIFIPVVDEFDHKAIVA